MERQFIRRLFTGKFIHVIAGYSKQRASRGEIHIVNAKVALVALDLPREFFFRELHRLAIDTLHRHYRALDKRTLLRQASHIQVLNGKPSIFRDAARNFIIQASREHPRRSNCHQQSN